MATDFDRFEEGRQKQTAGEPQGVYSDTVVERFCNPKNLGRLADPDAYGIVHGWCGDTMEIYIRLTGDEIKESRFMTDGCGLTVACGSMLTTMIEGLSVEEAQEITPQQLIEALDGLPAENTHCAKLAVDTLLKAIMSWSDEHPLTRSPEFDPGAELGSASVEGGRKTLPTRGDHRQASRDRSHVAARDQDG